MNELGIMADAMHPVKMTIIPEKRIIRIWDYCLFTDLYSRMKDMWMKYFNKYEFPVIAVTPNYFQVKNGWAIIGKRHIQDATFSYIAEDDKILFNHVCIKGVAAEDGLPGVEYKKRFNGQWYHTLRNWRGPNIIRFDRRSEGLWMRHDGKELDVNESIGAKDWNIKDAKGTIMIPWLWYNIGIDHAFGHVPVDDMPTIVEQILPDEWFEI